MSINSILDTRSVKNPSSRTAVIIIGAIASSLIFLAMAGLLYLFSRKERARRRNAHQPEEFSPLEPPPAYKTEELGTRALHPQPRPLSSFAPDTNRRSQRQYQIQQHTRSSYDQPPPYPTPPTLPIYDPSRYQPIRPSSMAGDINAFPYAYNPAQPANLHPYAHPHQHPGSSSRLSAVHYDARLTNSRPLSMAEPGRPMGPGPVAVPVAPIPGRQKDMPPPPEPSARQEGQERRERRERSASEPMLSQTGPRRPKPVLSRLITNFR
ncbi:uncharacterized protein N7515_001620 [Penicillium bovifimosum]|uniref:Uncharacterized protein n=1 Tax=Penicillium bovifimosum TaxID=126998 RepID=A0A9W9L8F1_9EURO|nr:uncharacterized protein N7515_001620 [Penicillium bovifimosum]KAJ5142833.1 hypothetical protein N7515_001620 [Penicillium bovifimosum]